MSKETNQPTEDYWYIDGVKGWCNQAVQYALKTGLSSTEDINKFVDETKKKETAMYNEFMKTTAEISALMNKAKSQHELDDLIDATLDEYNKVKHLIK